MSSGKTQKIVFLAHWVENWNWLLWFMEDLHRDPGQAGKRWYWAPLYYVMSLVYLVGGKAYDVVDRFMVQNRALGEIWLIRNFGWHFLTKGWRELIYRRIREAVIDAQLKDATVIGLGALTKAEWLTQGGKRLVDELGGGLVVPIVHGDTLTAATVIKQAEELLLRYDLGHTVFVSGATSKIGRAVVLSLARSGYTVLMLSESLDRVELIRREAGVEGARRMFMVGSYADGRAAKLWITGKAEAGSGVEITRFVPEGAVVLNFSVPDPLTPELLRTRPDLRHFDGGLLAYDPLQIRIRFTMRLKPGLTYACHAGTMVHGLEGWRHHEVGPVDMDEVWQVWGCAMKHGFALPHWTSHLRPVVVPEAEPVRTTRVVALRPELATS